MASETLPDKLRPLPPVDQEVTPLNGLFRASADAAPLALASRRRGSGRLKWLVLLFMLLAAAYATYHYWPNSSAGDAELAGVVTRGELVVLVTEPGELESAQSVSCRCEVEGRQIKIIDIVAEGTTVKKGQVVVKFDSEELMKAFQDQEIKLKQAEGKARVNEEELKVQQNQAESEIEKARLAMTVAELERDKFLSPQGEFHAQVEDAKGQIALATKELAEADAQLEHFRSFVKKGFGVPETLRQKEAAVERARFFLARDKAKLFVLEKYTYLRQKAELEAKARDAKRELERAESSSRARIEKAKSELEAAQITARLEKRALERIQKQLDNCEIKAPQEGILVYENARYWDPSSAIRPGGMVYYQQPVFKLPDLSRMKVKMKVHESQVKKVQKGQSAEISVASLPNRPLKGTVQSVATLADSRGYWDERGVKEYVTEVSIDELPAGAGLKPGMSAEVRVNVGRFPGVLMVPVSAVSERAGRHYAYISAAGEMVKREVKIGETNDKHVIIAEGLPEGGRVALNARKRLAAEVKAQEAAGGTAPTKSQLPAAPSTPSPGEQPVAAPQS